MNKIRISKTQENALLEKNKLYNNDKSKLISHYVKYRDYGCYNKDSSTAVFLEHFKDFELDEFVEILLGHYEVCLNKDEQVQEIYKRNNETIRKTFFGNNVYITLGFNQGIEFMNELYNLNIKLEEN